MKLTEQKLYKLIQEQFSQKIVDLLSSNLQNAKIAVDLMINAKISDDDQTFMLEKALMSVREYNHKTFLNDKLNELVELVPAQEYGL